MLGPILEGDRVRLEPPAREHLPSIAKWRTDLEATRYLLIFQFPPAPKQHEEWLEKVAASQDEIGWTFLGDKERWGGGLGTETARLRTSFAFKQLGFEKVMTEIYTGNTASIRMVEKVGFRQAGILRRHRFVDGVWQDLWLGEVLRAEWTD